MRVSIAFVVITSSLLLCQASLPSIKDPSTFGANQIPGATSPSDPSDSIIQCTRISDEAVKCGELEYRIAHEEESLPLGTMLAYIGISIALVLMAGMMSGLTLGLMSLDKLNLHILVQSGSPSQRKNALKILPLLDYHHWLLVTLLLCNAAAMEALPIFLDKLVSEVIAIIISVTAVLMFGEIIPQSICFRWGLAIGAHTWWLTRGLMWITCPISWPIGKLLDLLFGKESTLRYQRHELKEFINMHALSHEGPLSLDECMVINGALDLRGKSVVTSMTPIEKAFMVSTDEVVDTQFLDKIIRVGHSRVPVYQDTRDKVVGVLIVKKLVGKELRDKNLTVKQIGYTDVPVVPEEKGLYEQLNDFQTGRSHIAVVYNTGSGKVTGIITLEDLIEELIQEEIEDESDISRLKPRSPLLSSISRVMKGTMSARNSPLLGRNRTPMTLGASGQFNGSAVPPILPRNSSFQHLNQHK
eukprot:TRINITY_DN2229_c0_g1_i2.p1 TRINITY_DN2229_c0_g1~~TRINITY_DN2229_c0_g1_i2.p1  ORF type:complete len:471 (-),score=158.45 TRINITY_DN2229_c0_g1_i2:35-1447(-)